MSTAKSRFDDLTVRVLSAAVMIVIAGVVFWLSGPVLVISVSVLAGIIGWEISRMFGMPNETLVGIALGIVVAVCAVLPGIFTIPLIVAFAVVFSSQLKENRVLAISSVVFLMLSASAFLDFTVSNPMVWLVWLIGGVVLTDVAGYFAGKLLGGPKFWPSLSPKKTWSGTIAGWICAGCFGLIMAPVLGVSFSLAVVSVILSFSSQLGDIGESFVKRRTGVKDSSNLIPGHGGVWDRFDGVLGASIVVVPLMQIAGF